MESAQREAEARLPQLDEQRRGATDRLHEATKEVAGLEAALKALEAQQELLDTDEKLKDWVQSHGLERGERLWQAIKVEAGWDDAAEAALGVRLNAVKLTDEAQLPSLLRDAPPRNFAVFVERGTEIPPAASNLKPLSSVVSSVRGGVASYLRDALANVFILPEGEDGMALARVLPPAGLLVTRAGHLFSRQGVIFHGPQSELHGVLQRQREIEELQGRIPHRARERDDVQSPCVDRDRAARRAGSGAQATRRSGEPAPARP
jgi:chromosome segregation protein